MSGSCPQPSDTGQSSNNNIENAISHQTIETNDFNCTSYSGSLNNRLLSNLDHDLDDIDSTDELDDIDDLKGGDNGYMNSLDDCSNLTGLANNAAMFIEDDKRKRRAIANSNERRRMQSINAGFQTLKSLIPHSSGEKLSKACILQRSADFMQFLSNEKDKLSNKLQVALKILEANGLLSQFQANQLNTGNHNISSGKNSSLNFNAAKPTAATKINKQYVSSYTGNSATSSSSSGTAVAAATSLLSTALLTDSDIASSSCPQAIAAPKMVSDDEAINSTASSASLETPALIPIQNLVTNLTRTQVQPLDTNNNNTCSDQNLNSEARLRAPIVTKCTSNEIQKPTATTTITSSAALHKIEPTNQLKNIIINSSQLNTIDVQPLTIGLHQIKSLPELNIQQKGDVSSVNSLLIPNILIANTEPIQLELDNEHSQPTILQALEEPEKEQQKEPQSVQPVNLANKIAGYELTTESLVSLLNDIKGQNHNIDINSATNLILKSIISSNIILSSTPVDTSMTEMKLANSEESKEALRQQQTIQGTADSKRKKENCIESTTRNHLNIDTSHPTIVQSQQPQQSVQIGNSISYNPKTTSNSTRLETNILIASSKINQEKLQSKTMPTNVKVSKNRENSIMSGSPQSLTNNHLKNASLINKSSRSNSIDQLIAAAAVTAHSSACMSPLSPSNSPTGLAKTPGDPISQQDFDSNELNVSRKNLNTIVEAIFHVEGTSRLDEVMIDQAQLSRYQNSLPSSSCTASNSSCVLPETNQIQQQQKPPKKRKYTTEDITLTQEDQTTTSTPTKQSSQFISDYYNRNSARPDQCQSINKLLANKPIYTSPNENSGMESSTETKPSSGIKSESAPLNTSNKKRSSSNLVGLLVTS